jgi:hypothetical protein
LDTSQRVLALGDLTKAQYVVRRQAIEEEFQRFAPPADPEIDRAREEKRARQR